MKLLRLGLQDSCVNIPFRYESSPLWIPLSGGGGKLSLCSKSSPSIDLDGWPGCFVILLLIRI